MATSGKSEIKATNVTDEDITFITEHDGLSDATKQARWIHSPDEHEERKGETLATRSHEVIQRWSEDRNAKPAKVTGTEHDGRPNVIRFITPGYSEGDLQEIGWEDWFASFDERNLVFLFQEHEADGDQSSFFRLDSPEGEQD